MARKRKPAIGTTITASLPGMYGASVTLPYLGNATRATEILAGVDLARLSTSRIMHCPQCGRRLTWIGKVNLLCAHCLKRRN